MSLFSQWGIPILVAVAMAETRHRGNLQLAVQALSVLTEAATLSPVYRRMIVALRPQLVLFPPQVWTPLAMALAGGWDGEDGGEGVAMLAEQGLLAPLLGQWRLLRQVEWVAQCDAMAADCMTAPGLGLQGFEDPAGATASHSVSSSAVLDSIREAEEMHGATASPADRYGQTVAAAVWSGTGGVLAPDASTIRSGGGRSAADADADTDGGTREVDETTGAWQRHVAGGSGTARGVGASSGAWHTHA